AKGRPRFNPLIVHYADMAAAEEEAIVPARARGRAAAFWPGPLTLVLKRAPACRASLLCSAGLDSLAVRVPGHAVARAIIAAAGRPLAAPSANRSESLSPTTAAHVDAELGQSVALILDGGPCRIGLESTVLDLTAEGAGAVLLRPGGVPVERLEAVIGPILVDMAQIDASGIDSSGAMEGPQRSPGRLGRHYAPARPLRLGVGTDGAIGPNEALLAFGPCVPEGGHTMLNLSPTGDVVEAAAHLFAMLRALDRPEHAAIAVMAIPETGLGRAINDRLRRAISA
ncbi:MAG: L-threonylcarbamoyladenylate synthase, partial [Alphaproteobacteria bacterium]